MQRITHPDYTSETLDGQLCPYDDDCAHNLAIPDEGWYKCGHCERLFYARVWEGDFEDYYCYRLEERKDAPPAEVPTAKDLGASWGTPKK